LYSQILMRSQPESKESAWRFQEGKAGKPRRKLGEKDTLREESSIDHKDLALANETICVKIIWNTKK